MNRIGSGKAISTILKHDAKVTSYKIALLRAINDVVLSFPDLRNYNQDVAVPLRVLAEYWVAYYWPFVDLNKPVFQGQRANLHSETRNDIAFRPVLAALRLRWELELETVSRPSDGFFVINEMRVARKRALYSQDFLKTYQQAIRKISNALEMPIRYAGPGNWTVFARPVRYEELDGLAVSTPGTQSNDKCVVIQAELWQSFQSLSLWVEALCIHEWCLFSEGVEQGSTQQVDRGDIYRLLTDRPDNRRPLTWERNNIDLLLVEGHEFVCPWTEKRIRSGVGYDLDHLVPVSIYPINELWNLVPADPHFNSHVKRHYLPSCERLQQARQSLELAYQQYGVSKALAKALREDVAIRFLTVGDNVTNFPTLVTGAVVKLIDQVAESRNIARF
ncbi:hypothetical protein [Trichocoleus sp. FACHB-262]|uniref:hypothetical protein n=1 Tax=Trichocoleus sp. FACHB-262 TaxID=2692869 RepID=UPI00168232AF|nr:hypothetical protein [Trichocoleus sp. FACHB-262]MBD2122399.1 hypothetical protein [Trichocoleus sp. FACHB-262]